MREQGESSREESQINNRRYFLTTVISLLLLLLFLLPAAAYIYYGEKSGTEIYAAGLYEYELSNTYRVLGSAEELASGEEGLTQGQSTEEDLRLYVDALLRHYWWLTLDYDSTQEEEAERLRAKLARGDSYLYYGPHSLYFPDSKLIEVNKSFYGSEIHFEGRKNVFTGNFTEIRGLFARDELPADGGSIYFVRLVPMVAKSEVIWIETRDPVSGVIISKTQMERNRDYSIDYDTGEITFAESIASFTFEGNNNYIVVDYQYLPEAPGYRRYVTGARNIYQITDSLSLGASYLAEYDDRNSSTPDLSGRSPTQNSVWSIDARYKLGRDLILSTEYAKSQQDGNTLVIEDEEERSAQRSELRGQLANGSEVLLRYERVEPDFFNLGSGIKDDIEEYEFSLSHRLTEKMKFKGGYIYSHNNVLEDIKKTTTNRISDFSLTYQSASQGFFGAVKAEGSYRLEDEENNWYPQEERQSKIFSLKINMEPSETLSSFLTYQHEDVFSKYDGKLALKKDTATVGLEHSDRNRNSLTAQAKFINEQDLLTGESPYTRKLLFQGKRNLLRSADLLLSYEHSDTQREERLAQESDVVSAKLTYNPGEPFVFFLHSEVSRIVDRNTDIVSTTEKRKDTAALEYVFASPFAFNAKYQTEEERSSDSEDFKLTRRIIAELPYEPSSRFSLAPRYEFEEIQESLIQENLTLERKVVYSLKMDWHFTPKWKLFANAESRTVESALPPPAIKTVTLTGLERITYQISDRWDLMGQHEGVYQTEPQRSNKEVTTVELGYLITDNIRIGLGHRSIRFEDEAASENNYQADTAYLRLSGKI